MKKLLFIVSVVVFSTLISNAKIAGHKSLALQKPAKTAISPAKSESIPAKPAVAQAIVPPAPAVDPVAEVAPAPAYSATDCDQFRPLISQYSWNVDVALQVCQAESGGNPNNENATDYHVVCSGSRGLFQIGCDSTDDYADMFDPATNIAQAFKLYASRGWEPWGATTCAYKVACY